MLRCGGLHGGRWPPEGWRPEIGSAVRDFAVTYGGDLSGRGGQRACEPTGGRNPSKLSICLHAAEAKDPTVYVGGRFSGRHAPADRMGCRNRHVESVGHGFFMPCSSSGSFLTSWRLHGFTAKTTPGQATSFFPADERKRQFVAFGERFSALCYCCSSASSLRC